MAPTIESIAPPQAFSEQIGRKWIAALLVLGAALLLVAQFSAPPNRAFRDGAAVLAMISIVAVGIERIIEMFWSLVATFKSGWWPLNAIADAVQSFVSDTEGAVRPAFDDAIEFLEASKASLGDATERLAEVDREIEKVRSQKVEYENQVLRIKSLANDNQRVQLLATAAVQAVNRLDTAYGEESRKVRQAFNDVSQVATGVSDIVAGFKDNPGRKMISIYLGALIGLTIAGLLGLDLFAAAGAPLMVGGWDVLGVKVLPYVGIAVTGLVLGLGSNPTHQVVTYVTEAAKGRKTQNLGQPELPEAGQAGVAIGVADQSGILGASAAAGVGLRAAGGGRPTPEDLPQAFALQEPAVPSEGPGRQSPPRVRPGSVNLSRRR